MSFNFNVKASTLLAAVALAAAKMDEVIAQQPGHAADKDAVLGTIDAYSKLVAADGTYSSISSANVGVGVYMVDREKRSA